MATIDLGHHPELTKERVGVLLERRFGDRYEVEEKWGFTHDVIVKKSRWLAVGVKLRQGPRGTALSFSGFTPSFLLRMLPVLGVIGGIPGVIGAFLIMFLALRPSRKRMEEEVAEYIRNVGEFAYVAPHQGTPEGPPRGPRTQPALR